MSNITRGSIYTFLTQIPTQILGIIAGIFITRILGPEGRGIYAIFYADAALFSTLLGFSISTAIIQFKASERLDEGKLIGISVLFSMITMFLSLILLFVWIYSPLSHLFLPQEYITLPYLALFFVFLTLTQVNTVYSSYFQGARRFDIVNRVLLINSILNVSAYGALFLFNELYDSSISLQQILLTAVIVLFLNTLQWHYFFLKIKSAKAVLSFTWRHDIKPFMKFMGIGHLSNVINFFNYRLVLWIIAIYLNNYQLGLFALASGLTQLLGFISTPLSQVLMPYLSSNEQEERNRLFVGFSRVHFLILFLLSLFAALIAPLLIPVLYGTDFNASVLPFLVLLIGAILSGQTRVFASLLIANDQIKYNLYATIIGFGLTFMANFYLVKWYGIVGAAWAQSITYTGIFLSVYVAIITFTSVPTKNLFLPTKTDVNNARKRLSRKS